MKICVAQTKPVPGNIRINIDNHIEWINMALAHGAELIIFPELSLTGYEPGLAKELAMNYDDPRLDPFKKISNSNNIIIGVGIPTKNPSGICISMIFFHPDSPQQVYSKRYLHEDEQPWFTPGLNDQILIGETRIAPAICYEISVREHVENAVNAGAGIYLASVAKSRTGVNDAEKRMAEIAVQFNMTVLMSNCLGPCEGGSYECAGQSSIWKSDGLLATQLSSSSEGILIWDTAKNEAVKKYRS